MNPYLPMPMRVKGIIQESDDKTLRLWEVSTGRCMGTFEGHTHGVTSVALSA